MSRLLVLTEYTPSEPIRLTVGERDALRLLVSNLTVQPVAGSDDTYVLAGTSSVGVVRVGDLSVELQPKVGIAPVLFMVSYALDPSAWKQESAPLHEDMNLAEAIVPLFARAAHHAMRPGLLHGYRTYDDTVSTIRGRVRMAQQIRTRTGLPLPVEVAYDDFTPNILENQFLRTAVDVLGRLHLRHQTSRVSLARLHQQLNGIGSVISLAGAVPEPHWTRLNERYRPSVSLARLIISNLGLEARAGVEDASTFLVDMNAVFERFVRVALREALRLDARSFSATRRGQVEHLDFEGRIPLLPDLTWRADGRCIFVGDCKYKRPKGTVPNADVYQMLAYLTAFKLDEGLLVYAAGEDAPHRVTVKHFGKRILVHTLDVSRPPVEVLAQVRDLARLVRRLAAATSTTAAASEGEVRPPVHMRA